MAATADRPELYAELDQRLMSATRGISLLASVSWPASVELGFIAAWKAGNATLPQITYPASDHAATRVALDDIIRAADPAHPVGDYIRRNAPTIGCRARC